MIGGGPILKDLLEWHAKFRSSPQPSGPTHPRGGPPGRDDGGGGGVGGSPGGGGGAVGGGGSSKVDVQLDWTDNADNEDGFKIERETDGGGFSQIATVGENITTYTDEKLKTGSTYTYRVRAHNAAGDSDYSNEASVSP